MCFHAKASSQEYAAQKKQDSLFDTLSGQAKSIMGDASTVFKTLFKAFSPIVAAGKDQHGWNAETRAAINTQTVEGTAQTYNKASKALNEQIASSGGGNTYTPTGANNQLKEELAQSAAQSESAQKNENTVKDYEIGRQNFYAAEGVMAGLPKVYDAATNAGNAATSAGKASADTAMDITKAEQAPGIGMALLGAATSLGGSVLTGGMSNLGKGAGFFGGNA